MVKHQRSRRPLRMVTEVPDYPGAFFHFCPWCKAGPWRSAQAYGDHVHSCALRLDPQPPGGVYTTRRTPCPK